MAQEKNITDFCRYYRKDGDKPEQGSELVCWTAEKVWTERTEQLSENSNGFTEMLDRYIECGLSGFSAYDGIPLTLKATLFSFLSKLDERDDPEAFKRFYKENYGSRE